MDEKVIARFWAKVDKNGPIPEHCAELGPCWTWTASVHGKGYGQVTIHGATKKAHRVSWELTNGPIPDGLCALHRCDNPRCVSVGHLFLGTNADNVADKMEKGRHRWVTGDAHGLRLHPERVARGDRSGARLHPERLARGERNSNSKLIAADIIAIRQRLSAGDTQCSIAKSFGVSNKTISNIKKGLIWKHV